MDFLKSQLDRIQQQLAGLNASQKMLVACLVAIIVMTVAWWGGYAGKAEMEPLFQQALSPEEAGKIKRLLASHGIKASVGADNHVLVPAEQLNEAFAELAVSQALPKDPQINFQAFMKDLSPFASEKMGEAHLVNFKQARLAEVIGQFPGVAQAQVFIDGTKRFGLGGTAVEPSATVDVRTKDGKPLPQALVDGAGSLVMGQEAGLTWKRVTVMVNGVPRRLTDPDVRGAASADVLAEREQLQKDYAERVANVLKIPDVSVTVTFGMDKESLRRKKHTFDKDNTFTKDVENTERTSESNQTDPAGGAEPGAMPNVGMSINGAVAAAAGGSNTTESESKTKSQVFPSDVTEDSFRPPGVGDPIGAAVLVPRSYIVRLLTLGKKDAPDPDESAVAAWLKQREPNFQKIVKNTVGLANADAVSVDMYVDLIPPPAPAGAAPQPQAGLSTGGIVALAGSHSREIVLGGLAVASLFMVSMMARRPPTVVAPLASAGAGVLQTPMPVLDASEALAGEVGEGKSMLDAMELDEDAVRAQQMVDQVAAMVEDNPDAAAGLVKRWMSRT